MLRKLFYWIFKAELEQLQLITEKNKENYLLLQQYLGKTEARLEIIKSLQSQFENVLKNIDVSVDVHEYHRRSNSWAVISLQGKKTDYIKFVDLGESNIHEISAFLRQFERNANIKVYASPYASEFLRIKNNKF